MNTFSPQTNRGFTLVETLVAIAILLVAIVGPFYAVSKSITAAYVARDQLTASSLAQEGAEYLYTLRDSNYLAGYTWLAGVDGSSDAVGHSANCFSPNKCVIDVSRDTIQICPGGGCPAIGIDTGGLYTQDTSNWPSTRFTRSVQILPVLGAPYEVQVVITVTWKTLGRTYTAVVNDELYNWL